MKNKLISNVFIWLFVGLLVTFVTSYTITLNDNMVEKVYGGFYWIILIAEIGVAIFLSARINKMSKPTAICLYLLYAFLTGLTLAYVFIIYTTSSLAIVFLITCVLFGLFALIGKFTNLDLTKFGTYLMMALIAILILSLINAFVGNSLLDTVICALGVIVFLGYTAYDLNKIIKSSEFITDEESNLPIIYAFTLYIDFINLFIDLLRLFGKTDD